MTISRAQMPRELYQTGTDPEAEKLAKELNISVLEARRILNTLEDTTFIQQRPEMQRGGIADLVPRQQYGFGGITKAFKSVAKGITGAVKGAVDTAKDFAKSDIGQIALAIAAPQLMAAYGPASFATFGGTGFVGNALRSGILNLGLQGITTGKFDLGQAAKAGVIGGAVQTGLQNYQQTGNAFKPRIQGDVTTGSTVVDSAVVPQGPEQTFAEQLGRQTSLPTSATAGTVADASSGIMDIDSYYGGAEFANQVPSTQQATLFTAKAPTTSMRAFEANVPSTDPSVLDTFEGLKMPYQAQDISSLGVPENLPTVTPTRPEGIFATLKSDMPISDKAANIFLKNPEAPVTLKNLDVTNIAKVGIPTLSIASALSVPKLPEETDDEYELRMSLVKDFEDKYGKLAGVSTPSDITDYETFFSERANVAIGGMPMVPMGKPRQNANGVTELDYRDEGGFVPVGIKEKADDVPAMLSKNEFVFTANAVRNAGDGDVDKGAERLYKTMKTLENGGTLA